MKYFGLVVIALASADVVLAQNPWQNGASSSIYYTSGAVGVLDSSPSTYTGGLKAGAGQNFSQITLGSVGAFGNVFAAADGTAASPQNNTTASGTLQRYESGSHDLTAYTVGMKKTGGGGFQSAMDVSMDVTVANSGSQSDLVALGADAYCHAAGTISGAQNCYGMWLRAGKTNERNFVAGMELDLTNDSNVSAAWPLVASPGAAAGTVGIAIYSAASTTGQFNGLGLAIGSHEGTGQWHVGVQIADYDTVGLYFANATSDTYYHAGIAAIQIPNSQWISATNAANSAAYHMLAMDSSNVTDINGYNGIFFFTGSGSTYVGGWRSQGGLQINGGSKPGCSAGLARMLFYVAGTGMQLCNGTAWKTITAV